VDSYTTYQEGVKNGYFVPDTRYDAENPDGKTYYKYAGGKKYGQQFNDKENNYNTGDPFIGEVYYGQDGNGAELGTTGHYPDFNRGEVRKWWGKQYQHLFDLGWRWYGRI
jgi:alpha-glucosidase